ncbi:MAG: ABC transporter substrate-binding protein [Candidatus Poribacteria bacterium]|nr:ABC transporter substrate-binding protein [Candidatus Poribacteria bacterium]
MVTITRFSSFTLILGLIAGLCGCDLVANILLAPDEGADGGGHIVDEPITMSIGMVAPLTGRFASSSGLSMERGFLVARDEINEFELNPVRIEFIIEDNQSTTEGTIAAFERLIDAGVPAIVGLAVSTHAKQAFPIAQENKVVAFSPISSAAGLSSIGDYIFRAALAVDRLNPAGVRTTHALLGYERVALIYDAADVFSTSSNQYFAATLKELGVEVTTMQTFQTGDTDFTAQLTEIMESNPDAVFISALDMEAVSIMIQGREIGTTARYITPQLRDGVARLAGAAAEGTVTFTNWSSTLDNPINQNFVERYRTTYGIEPDTRAAQSYATLFILYVAILEALGQSSDIVAPDAMAIRDALAMTKDFDTNMGPFSFDSNGEAIHKEVVLVVKDGRLVLFGDGDMLD